METSEEIVVYMCKTSWDHEVGVALGGVRVYPSAQNLKEDCRCYEECGIVEVKMELLNVIEVGTL